MLQNAAAVAQRVGVLLDDPTLSKYTQTYQMPFIDQEYDELDVELEQLGMQYVEGIATFDLQIGESDLSPYLLDGQPLQYMKWGKRIDWKLKGQEDVAYRTSTPVQELDYVQVSNLGAWQWKQADGALQVTPSNGVITLKVYFDTISTNIVDPAQNVIRGTAHILALRVAVTILGARGDLSRQRLPFLEKKMAKAWGAFKSTLVMYTKQIKSVSARPIHARRLVSSFFVPAPSDTGDGDLS